MGTGQLSVPVEATGQARRQLTVPRPLNRGRSRHSHFRIDL